MRAARGAATRPQHQPVLALGAASGSGRPPGQRPAAPAHAAAPAASAQRYMQQQDIEIVRQNLVSRMAYASAMTKQEQPAAASSRQQQPGGGSGGAVASATESQRQQQQQQGGEAGIYNPSDGWRRLPHHLTQEQVWQRIREESKRDADAEPTLASFLYSSILAHKTFEQALAFVLANKLASPTLYSTQLKAIAEEVYAQDPGVITDAMADLQAVLDRDPACDQYTSALLHFKGFQALQSHRVAHHLWRAGRRALAVMLQSRISEAFHVDVHPAAAIGRGILLDHATGVVIGETASIGDNVSMLHHVTLGGSGVGKGTRHPRVGHGVLLGAGVTVLGPVTLGPGCKVGAGSVVVTDLPAHSVAVGVPARIVKRAASEPSEDMDQTSYYLDYTI